MDIEITKEVKTWEGMGTSSGMEFRATVEDIGAGEPNPLDTMYYGKYKGRTIMSIAKEDPDYAQWASANLKKQKERDSFLLALKSLS